MAIQNPIHKITQAVQQAQQAAKQPEQSNQATPTVKKFPSYKSFKLSTNKTIGVLIWLAGAWLTVQTLRQMNVPEATATVFGIVLQLAFTRGESPLWKGKGAPKMAVFALLLDVSINSGGAWPYTMNIGNTDFWTMLKDIIGNPGMAPTIATQIALAVGLGIATAAAAEYYWNLPD